MDKYVMETFAEVDMVLSLMEDKYIAEIPEKLRKMFKENKAMDYKKEITANQPLKEQNLKKETLSILAILNYQYWCKDENRKRELIELYTENEKKHQAELREKYNPDEIFKKDMTPQMNSLQETQENLSIIKVNEGLFSKIKNWLIIFFKSRW